MKFGIISDTHGHVKAWETAVQRYFGGAEFILHAGDVLAHGPKNPRREDYDPMKLAGEINASPVPVIIARGNCDAPVDDMVLEMPVLSPYAHVYMDGLRIIVTHGDTCLTDAEKDDLAAHLKADLFITGHTHVTVLEKRGNTVFLNPGSAALSKREDGKNTAATFEDGKIRIFALDTGEVLMEKELA